MSTRSAASPNRPLAQPGTRPRPARRGRWWQLVLVWLLLPALIAVSALAYFQWSYLDRIYPGVQALGIDLSGKTWTQAVSLLSQAAVHEDLPPLALRHGNQAWPLKAEELGMQVDVLGLAEQAFAAGRNSTLPANLATQWQTFWQGRRLEPAISVQPGLVTSAIASRTTYLNRAVTEAKITLNDLQVVVSASRPGQMVDVETTRDHVLDHIVSGQGGMVDVVVRPLAANETDLSAEQTAIQQLLDHPIVLADTRGEFQFALDPAALAGMLELIGDRNTPGGLRAEIKEDRLRDLASAWAKQVERPPLNARFDFDTRTNTLVELSTSADGYALDVDATVAAILSAIKNRDAQAVLPVQILRPQVASDAAANFGIKELVAEGVSSFKGSAPARVKNIEVAAAKLVGVVIPPDGVFSFIEHVGDVTAANGFEDSLVIAGDTTAVGVGGGVCQVSTTVFRAAWFGGFPIEERWNHGYVVSWYGAPGLDATIYTPKVDFKFRNTTGHHLLIKPVVDSQAGVIKLQFFGTQPNWRVETSGPTYAKRTPSPAPLYVEDPSLPAGKVVQFDWSVEGLDAVAQRRVLAADGSVISAQTLKSHYLPWQAKFRYGPGFEPPAGAEVKRAG